MRPQKRTQANRPPLHRRPQPPSQGFVVHIHPLFSFPSEREAKVEPKRLWKAKAEACLHACARACVRACVRAGVRACVRACVRARGYVCVNVATGSRPTG